MIAGFEALLYRKGESGKREKTGRERIPWAMIRENERGKGLKGMASSQLNKKEGTVFTVPSLSAALLIRLTL